MSRYCGVERSADGLETLIELIDQLEARYGDEDALIAARFIACAALRREESRGGHFRMDFPQRAQLAAHTQLRLDDLSARKRAPARQSWPAE